MQYDERTRTLLFSNLFMRSFAEQHRSLAQFVDGMRLMLTDDEQRLMHGWRMLKVAWSEYYDKFGDGAEALSHFTHACLAAGARVSPNAQNAPNCVYFALGEYIGASDVAAQINRALVGSIRTTSSGRREPVDSFLWPDVLSDLGFEKAEYPIVGDLIVYTILGGADLSDELAVHFGRVVAADEHHQDGIMVESKSGYAFDVYVHPINVVDPTYLIRSPCMRVHAFRPVRGPLPRERLVALAARYEVSDS